MLVRLTIDVMPCFFVVLLKTKGILFLKMLHAVDMVVIWGGDTPN